MNLDIRAVLAVLMAMSIIGVVGVHGVVDESVRATLLSALTLIVGYYFGRDGHLSAKGE